MSTDPSELLGVAKAAAAAGAAVLSTRSSGSLADGTVSNKGEAGDWVTAFDVAAENAVRSAIRGARPQDTITGEEHGTTRPENPSGLRWSIDPLDGTTNFIRNIVYYATSVAVADADGVWLAGVVNAPALGRVYYAARGHGAWLEQDGHRVQLTGPVSGTGRPDPGHGVQLRSGGPGASRRRRWAASWRGSRTCGGSARRLWTFAWWPTARTMPSVNGA